MRVRVSDFVFGVEEHVVLVIVVIELNVVCVGVDWVIFVFFVNVRGVVVEFEGRCWCCARGNC